MSDRFERDLADALRSLATDPAQDWARVMNQLPAAAAPRRPVWPWVAAAAAAGLVLGFVVSHAASPAPGSEPRPGPPQVAVAPLADLPRVVGLDGRFVEDTDDGPRDLQTGDRIAYEQFVATVEAARAIVVMADGVELRFDKDTRVALLGERSFELAQGRLQLKVPESSRAVHLAMLDGEVLATAGIVQIAASEGRTDVIALDGTAEYTAPTGEKVDLQRGARLTIADGMPGAVEPIGMVWDHVAWQIDLLAGCADRREEAFGWTWTLIDALEQPATAMQAERALRGAGAVGAAVLGMATYDLPKNQDALRRRCWLLLADVADASALVYLMGGTTADDADVRVATVAAIERITAIPSGRDAAFWRDAAPAARFDVVLEWRGRLRGF